MKGTADVLETGDAIYRSDAKLLWRRRLWGHIADKCPALRDVAMMPGSGQQEITVVRSLGVPDKGMRLIDRNAAIVASQRRRNPGVGGTYGVTVARAFERMSSDGVKLDAVHLDFCSCITPLVLTELRHIVLSNVLRPHAVVALTVLRGRETGPVKRQFDQWAEWDEVPQWDPDMIGTEDDGPSDYLWDGGPSGLRVTWRDHYRGWIASKAMCEAAGTVGQWWPVGGDHWQPFVHGAYRSRCGTQTMYWCCLAIPDEHGGESEGPHYTEGVMGTFGVRSRLSARGAPSDGRHKAAWYSRCATWLATTGSKPEGWVEKALINHEIRDVLSWEPKDCMRIYGVGPSNYFDAYRAIAEARQLFQGDTP